MRTKLDKAANIMITVQNERNLSVTDFYTAFMGVQGLLEDREFITGNQSVAMWCANHVDLSVRYLPDETWKIEFKREDEIYG